MAEASERTSLASGQKLKIIHTVERRGEDWKSMGKRGEERRVAREDDRRQ